MQFFRQLLNKRKFLTLLAFGMLLRSAVAMGYMLDTSPADDSLFSIKLCDGPAGINAIAGMSDPHHAHHHDAEEQHEHQTQDHPYSSCSLWSSSSQSLANGNSSAEIIDAGLSDEAVLFQQRFTSIQQFHNPSARAPPSLI